MWMAGVAVCMSVMLVSGIRRCTSYSRFIDKGNKFKEVLRNVLRN